MLCFYTRIKQNFIHPQNKTPSPCMTPLSQKYIKDIGLCKKKIKDAYPKRYATCFDMSKEKRIKDAYPKKVCHMLRHVKKKRERKDSPLSKKKEKKERDGTYKGVHTPSTKNFHTLAHLDQGL